MTDQFQMSTRFYDLATNTAANIITYLEGDNRQQTLDTLRTRVANYAQIDEKFKRLKDITSRYVMESRAREEAHAQGEHSSHDKEQSLYEKYDEEVDKIEVNAAENKHLKNFGRQVEQLMSSYGGEQGNQEDEDEEMTVRANVNVICPITKTRMKEPMKNDLCGHIYDKDSIVALISVNPRCRCPVVGCSNKEYLHMSQMNPDIVTRVYLERNP